MSEPRIHGIVLAGGSGQRFWPLSRDLSPKQLMSMFGTESLIVAAVRRIAPFTGGGRGVTVVTSERLFDELRSHLMSQRDPQMHEVSYIQEPLARNTAPAIALAAAMLELEDPDAIMVILPSDHLLEDGEVWSDCIHAAVAAASDGWLVTIGIAPVRPETGYGYIRSGASLPEYARGAAVPRIASEFVEKPNAERAAAFLAGGEHFWNAGIFVMKASRVLEELERAGGSRAHIANVVRGIAALPESDRHGEAAREAFDTIEPLSIDVAVMERSDKVAVIPAPMRWSDVGSLLSLHDITEPDAAGNVRVGRGVDIDSRNTIVYSTDRLVATLGVEDLIVVDTADATLILPKDRAQDVRAVVEALRRMDASEVVEPRSFPRPWGSWTLLLKSDGFQIKSMEVNPGARLSLHSHERRIEHWIVLEGSASVTLDEEIIQLESNESAYMPAGVVHKLENVGAGRLVVVEVATGEYLGEDDITRYEDDWDR